MVKKIAIVILSIVLTAVLSGIYGMLHDQVSYSISPEYFTKFKFEQFGFNQYGSQNDRINAAFVGFLATWWTGLIIGFINGVVGLIQSNAKLMWKSVSGATIRTVGIAILTGLLGILVGYYMISEIDAKWMISPNVLNQKAFLTVGTMHNFSYLDGLIGLIVGILYQIRLKIRSN